MPKKYRACQYAILKKLDQNSENPKYCTSIIIAAKQDFTLRHQCRGVIADTGSKKITWQWEKLHLLYVGDDDHDLRAKTGGSAC